MILKICELHEDNFWLYDGLVRIKKNGTKYREVVEDSCLSIDAPIPVVDAIDVEINGEEVEFFKLYCRTKNGKEFYILFRGTAYICNDANKTLEIIHWL